MLKEFIKQYSSEKTVLVEFSNDSDDNIAIDVFNRLNDLPGKTEVVEYEGVKYCLFISSDEGDIAYIKIVKE